MATVKKHAAPKPDAGRGEWEKRAIRWVEILAGLEELRQKVQSAAADGIVDDQQAYHFCGRLSEAECCILDSGVPSYVPPANS